MVHPRYRPDLATGFVGGVLSLVWVSVVPLPLALLALSASGAIGALAIHALTGAALAVVVAGWLRARRGPGRLVLAAAGLAALSAQLLGAAGL